MAKNSTATTTETQDGPQRFTLKRPYDFRGTRYEGFTAREPRVRDLRKFLKGAETDSILAIESVLADLCSVDQPVIAEMAIADFGAMKRWFESHLSDLVADNDA